MGIPIGRLLAGYFPKDKLKLVEAWVEIHKDELMADWRLAVESDFRLEWVFSDGTGKIADIKPFLSDEAFKPLLDPGIFFPHCQIKATL